MALPQQQAPLAFDDYVNATSLQRALRALADGRGTPVAGGTDLWLQKDLGAKRFGARLVNIRRVPEIAGISEADGRIRLGALVTMTEVLESELLRRATPFLVTAADCFASNQIRNVATVGGNIVNASPAADFVLPLLCLDAEVELASWRDGNMDIRRLPLDGLFVGPGRTRRAANELITAVMLARPPAAFHAAFVKSGPRPALEIARVAMAISGVRDVRRLENVRLAYGAVAATPIRCPRTETLLDGAALDETTIQRALDSVEGEVRPIDDVRATAWFRRRLVRAYLEQELRRVAQG